MGPRISGLRYCRKENEVNTFLSAKGSRANLRPVKTVYTVLTRNSIICVLCTLYTDIQFSS